jgi:hypothetical protein
MLEPFDLWFSQIVLQHNSPPIIAMILRRAMQLLNPGGLAIFQVPTFSPGYRFRVTEYVSNLPNAGMEMHVLPQPAIFEIAVGAGCVPLEVLDDYSTGSQLWVSNSFAFAKSMHAESAHGRPRRNSVSAIAQWLSGAFR